MAGRAAAPDRTIWSVAFAPPDGRLLAVGSDDGRVVLLDITVPGDPAVVPEFDGRHNGRVYAVAFSADGRTLASAGEDRVVKLWGTSTRRLHATLRGHDDAIRALAFAPPTGSGRSPVLASGDDGGAVRRWAAEAGP